MLTPRSVLPKRVPVLPGPVPSLSPVQREPGRDGSPPRAYSRGIRGDRENLADTGGWEDANVGAQPVPNEEPDMPESSPHAEGLKQIFDGIKEGNIERI